MCVCANVQHLASSRLLVYANKQDLAGCMKPGEIADQLDLTSYKTQRWHIQGCCALTGDGLVEGLDWVTKELSEAT